MTAAAAPLYHCADSIEGLLHDAVPGTATVLTGFSGC